MTKGRHQTFGASGLSKDQKNAVFILEEIMHRKNYTSDTRDDLATCLTHVRLDGVLGQKLPTIEREAEK